MPLFFYKVRDVLKFALISCWAVYRSMHMYKRRELPQELVNNAGPELTEPLVSWSVPKATCFKNYPYLCGHDIVDPSILQLRHELFALLGLLFRFLSVACST